ncbi:MAG: tetratricopeptide repeat protein [Candidatus Thorarchaeota archaeon]
MEDSKSQSGIIRTPDYRLRVFVSSTLKELAEEREAVHQAILQLRLAPVMFELGARPHPADDLYQAYLAQSHIFIGIYWQSYGWIAPDKKISGLEDEYNLSTKIPRLLYIKSPAPDREPALKGLLDKIRNQNVGCYKSFATPDELRELVENDLALLLTERFEASRQEEKEREDSTQHPLTNVPFPRNPLIGREQEIRTACELLLQDNVALVTLTGPGGCGKSRLGIQIALELRDRFLDGVYLVMLEVISDPELVIPIIARTLGVTETTGEHTLFESLKAFLHKKKILLILDNFEQVLPASLKVADLLEGCPRTKILVTSRSPLRLRAERELPVPPLELPPSKQISHLQPLSQYSAVQLFIQRAQSVKPDFRITNENAPAVAEICHRLDGLPLAIELASARIRMLSPNALLQRLDHSFDVLRGGTRDSPERQQTLHNAIEWSYNFLNEPEKRLLRRLSVFVGGWTFEVADAVCNAGDGQRINIFDGFEKLVDLNLIKPPQDVNGDLRLNILETIREFSYQQLIKSGEMDVIRSHQAQFYLTLVEQAEPELRANSQTRWVNRLDSEYGNIRAVLEWSRQHDAELGLKMCGAIWRFWEMHNYIGEGREWLETFIKLSLMPTTLRGKVLTAAAALAVYQGDFKAARTHVEEALSIHQYLDDKHGIARAYNELGLIASYEGDYGIARQFLEKSLAIKRDLGDEWSIASSINNLGLLAGYQKDYVSAYSLHKESLAIYRALNDKIGVAIATGNLGHDALHLSRFDEASKWHTESLQLFNEIGDKDGLAECFERLAILANAKRNFKYAAQLFGTASALREISGTLPALADKEEYERELKMTRMKLDITTFDAAWQEGYKMTLEEAISSVTSNI